MGSGIIDKGSGNTTSPNDVDLEGRNDNPAAMRDRSHSLIQTALLEVTTAASEDGQRRLGSLLPLDRKARTIRIRRCWPALSTLIFAQVWTIAPLSTSRDAAGRNTAVTNSHCCLAVTGHRPTGKAGRVDRAPGLQRARKCHG